MDLKKFKRMMIFVVFALTILGILGCDKPKTPDEIAGGQFSSLYTNWLKGSCVECHAPGTQAYDVQGILLNFTTQQTAYSSLTTLTSKSLNNSNSCQNIKMITSSKSNESFLYLYLVSGQSCYDSAHGGYSNINDTRRQQLLDWINSGASAN